MLKDALNAVKKHVPWNVWMIMYSLWSLSKFSGWSVVRVWGVWGSSFFILANNLWAFFSSSCVKNLMSVSKWMQQSLGLYSILWEQAGKCHWFNSVLCLYYFCRVLLNSYWLCCFFADFFCFIQLCSTFRQQWQNFAKSPDFQEQLEGKRWLSGSEMGG